MSKEKHLLKNGLIFHKGPVTTDTYNHIEKNIHWHNKQNVKRKYLWSRQTVAKPAGYLFVAFE